jgi:hypothetical protein
MDRVKEKVRNARCVQAQGRNVGANHAHLIANFVRGDMVGMLKLLSRCNRTFAPVNVKGLISTRQAMISDDKP